jgi:cyanophycinase
MRILAICFLFTLCTPLAAQLSTSSRNEVQIITSGGGAADSVFINLVGDPDAMVIFIPTAASALRLPNDNSGVIWNPDEEKNKKEFKQELLKRFKLTDITILHTRSREEANTESFVAPLKKAKAIWISGGNPGRFMSTYRGTHLEKELKMFLKRGGIIAGESAGAIVLGTYTIRGNPEKPVLMVEGSEKGLGIIPNVAINPHLSASKRENELVTVIDKYPYLLGIGIDDNTGFLIRDGIGEVFGQGRIAIYTNEKYKTGWYYWLKPGDKFDFGKKLPINFSPE